MCDSDWIPLQESELLALSHSKTIWSNSEIWSSPGALSGWREGKGRGWVQASEELGQLGTPLCKGSTKLAKPLASSHAQPLPFLGACQMQEKDRGCMDTTQPGASLVQCSPLHRRRSEAGQAQASQRSCSRRGACEPAKTGWPDHFRAPKSL